MAVLVVFPQSPCNTCAVSAAAIIQYSTVQYSTLYSTVSAAAIINWSGFNYPLLFPGQPRLQARNHNNNNNWKRVFSVSAVCSVMCCVTRRPDLPSTGQVILNTGHPLSEVTNILYPLALVILPLVLIGWHNHRRKMTFIIYLLLANTLSISPLIGMWEQPSSLCAWARCDDSWCWLKSRYLSLPTGREWQLLPSSSICFFRAG